MITPYNIPSVMKNGASSAGLRFSNTIYDCVLATDVDKEFTIPGGAGLGASPTVNQRYAAVIKSTNDMWMALNEPAVATVSTSFVKTATEYVPFQEAVTIREVQSGDVLHFITNLELQTAITIMLYSL